MMKNVIFLMSFLFAGYGVSFGQVRHEKDKKATKEERKKKMMEKMESMKVAHLSSQMDLTPEQAKDFWPIYDAFDKKRKDMRQSIRPEKPISEMTEAEAQDFLMKSEDLKKDIEKERKDLTEKLSQIISAKQILQLQKAEHEFSTKVKSELHKRKKKGSKHAKKRMRKNGGENDN